MAVTFLILAVEKRPDPTSEDQLAAYYRKGSIIAARPHTWEWGPGEGLPTFVKVTVTGVTYAQVQPYMKPWVKQAVWSVVASDLATDIHTVKLSSGLIRADGRGGFSAGEVDAFLTPWKATGITVDNGEVTFTLNVFDALTSPGFWGRDVSAVTFVQDSYSQVTGQHTITATIPEYIHLNAAMSAIIARGGDILDSDAGARTVQYQMARDDVAAVLREQVRRKTLKTVARARYYISEANVDAIIGAGGHVTITLSQFRSALLDHTV